MDSEQLLKKVEVLRKELYRIKKGKKNLTNQELLEMSRRIDELLNNYIRKKNAEKARKAGSRNRQ